MPWKKVGIENVWSINGLTKHIMQEMIYSIICICHYTQYKEWCRHDPWGYIFNGRIYDVIRDTLKAHISSIYN